MVPAIYLFDRFDGRLGILPAVASLAHTEELGGEDTIEFDCAAGAREGGPACCGATPRTAPGASTWWRAPTSRLAGPARVYAESSISELLGDFIEEERLSAKTAAEALAAVLAHTRWTAGDVGRGRRAARLPALPRERARRAEARRGGLGRRARVLDSRGGRARRRAHGVAARAARGLARGAAHARQGTHGLHAHGAGERGVHGALRLWARAAGPGRERRAYRRLHQAAYLRRREQRRELGGQRRGAPGMGAARRRRGPGAPVRMRGVRRVRGRLRAEGAHRGGACAGEPSPRGLRGEAARVCGCGFVGLGDDVAVCDDARNPPWRFTARCVRRIRELGAGGIVRRLTLGAVERTSWSASADVAARVATVEETAAAAGEAAAAAAGAVSSLEDLSEMEF